MSRAAILNCLHLICSLAPKITPALACDKYLQGLVMEMDTSVGDAVWLRKENYYFFNVSFIPVSHRQSSQLEHMNIHNKLMHTLSLSSPHPVIPSQHH